MRKVEIGAVLIVSVLLLILGSSYSVGWLLGCLVLLIIRWNRNRFYSQIIDMTSFNLIQYVAYTVSFFVLMGGSFLIAFYFKNYINPYTLFAAFFAERVFNFFLNAFAKGGIHNVSK